MALNMDGLVDRNKMSIVAGGVIKNEHGRILVDFAANLGCSSITRAELLQGGKGYKR
ncbi:hypothetical protein LINPERHAP1_LOCUS26402 [Linum perenne]